MPTTRPYNVLVLDIDETLVWTELWPEHDCDFYLTFGTNPISTDAYGVKKRPGVDEFLRWCFASHEIFRTAIWTAGTSDYAAEICKHLLLPGETPEFVWARDKCSRVLRNPDEFDMHGFIEIKDLKKLRRQGYSLDRILHLDNTPQVARRNYGNLVVIPSYNGQPGDRYLEMLPPFLLDWFAAPSVRTIEKRGWWRYSSPDAPINPYLDPPVYEDRRPSDMG